jgi:alpha/beta superfamily hydrolase
MGGDRRDSRLTAVSDTLGEHSIACLRFDYDPWDEGRAEVTDCASALALARERFERVGLFGYSFGGAVALRAAAEASTDSKPPAAVSVLAPAGTLAGQSVADDIDGITCPLQVLYGERDGTVDSVPVADRARDRGASVTALPADHFYAGQLDTVADTVAEFLSASL